MKMKKSEKRFLIGVIGVFMILLPCMGQAEIPGKINYQGYLTSAAGVPVNATVAMVFSFYTVDTGGSLIWTETQNVTVNHGVYNVNLGDVTPITSLPFGLPYYLGIKVGADPEMTPRIPLTSVGYAFRAKTADYVYGSGTFSNTIISTVATGTAPMQVSSTTNVTNLNADLLDGQHAAAFAMAAHNHDSSYVNVTGDTMSGTLNVSVGSGNGVTGHTSGSGTGVRGYTTGTGNAGYFEITNATNSSNALHASTNGSGTAVAGYVTGINNPGTAVLGQTAGKGHAGVFVCNDFWNTSDCLIGRHDGNGTGVVGSSKHGFGVYGYSETNFAGYFDGDFFIAGHLTKGSGSFVQPHPTEPTKELVYAFFEGPEHAIFLRGTATLTGGKAAIETPEHFRVVAGDKGITVQFTPRYVDTFGLAAVEVTKEKILVQELKGGTNTYEFDYFITAKRAGFEKHEPIQPNKHFKADNVTKEMFERRYAKTDDMTIAAMRNLLISNRILTKDGKLNMEIARRLGWTLKETETAKVQE